MLSVICFTVFIVFLIFQLCGIICWNWCFVCIPLFCCVICEIVGIHHWCLKNKIKNKW